MRVYIETSQLMKMYGFLQQKDVAVICGPDMFELVKLASDKKSWGVVICPIYGANDVRWLLDSWNRHGNLIQVEVVTSPTLDFVVACPPWASEDPFVRVLVRKLSGTKAPPSPVDWVKCDGLVPVTAQDALTKDVLMQAFMDEVAWAETLKTGRAVYFSRSRRKLWRKGEESGNVQIVKEIRIDCDLDSVILLVEQVGGAACHTGHASCFFQRVEADGGLTVVGEPVFDPSIVYKKGN